MRFHMDIFTDHATATPKSKATPKKRTKKDVEAVEGEAGGDDDEEASAKKKPKTPRKKKAAADTEADGEDGAGDGSPAAVKKPKTTRKKAALTKKKSEEVIKEEADEGEAFVASAISAEEGKKDADKPKTPIPAAEEASAEDVKMEGAGDE